MANVGPPAEVQVLQSAILVLAPRALAHPQPNLLHVLQIFEAQGHIRNLLPRIHTKSIMRRSNLAVSVGPFKQCISFDLCSAGQIKTFFGSLDCLQCLVSLGSWAISPPWCGRCYLSSRKRSRNSPETRNTRGAIRPDKVTQGSLKSNFRQYGHMKSREESQKRKWEKRREQKTREEQVRERQNKEDAGAR